MPAGECYSHTHVEAWHPTGPESPITRVLSHENDTMVFQMDRMTLGDSWVLPPTPGDTGCDALTWGHKWSPLP